MKKLAIALFFVLTTIISAQSTKQMTASYYHQKFVGRKTASGEVYNSDSLTTAHRTLPMGTRLMLINETTQDTVIVRVNDRGPYAKKYKLDVSLAAAKKLGMLRKGSAKLTVIILP
jgi:rare lipoprotein A